MTITLAQFLAGQPLAFTSFSGKPYTARWFQPPDAPLHSLEIRDAQGRRLKWFFAARHEASSFYATATDPSLCGDVRN